MSISRPDSGPRPTRWRRLLIAGLAGSLTINLIGAAWIWHSIRYPLRLPVVGYPAPTGTDDLARAKIGLELAVSRLRQALTTVPYDGGSAATAAADARFWAGEIARYHRSAMLGAANHMARGDREILADRLPAFW